VGRGLFGRKFDSGVDLGTYDGLTLVC
jgi:hypothetical protein